MGELARAPSQMVDLEANQRNDCDTAAVKMRQVTVEPLQQHSARQERPCFARRQCSPKRGAQGCCACLMAFVVMCAVEFMAIFSLHVQNESLSVGALDGSAVNLTLVAVANGMPWLHAIHADSVHCTLRGVLVDGQQSRAAISWTLQRPAVIQRGTQLIASGQLDMEDRQVLKDLAGMWLLNDELHDTAVALVSRHLRRTCGGPQRANSMLWSLCR